MTLEENRIYCGDALKLLREVPSESVPLILTDIPYGVVSRVSAGLRNLDKGAADICEFSLRELTDQLLRVARGSIYVFCGTEQVSELRANLAEAGLTTRLCIWEKTNPNPMNAEHLWMSSIETCVFARRAGATFNAQYRSCVWRYPSGKSTDHPTEKPLALFEELVRVSSAPGDLVLDPFVGSGTTAAAAHFQGRRYLCFDNVPEYVELARARVVQNTIF